ncbi:MAG: Rieske (2Fe-2S) protein [Deltaproteobacteria bacterium]|nr:Rieske (2Fe-2S) protein [Deltaproteobacteria bacterium]
MTNSSEKKQDPQHQILVGHGGFGVEYVPKSKRTPVLNGRIFVGKKSDYVAGQAKTFPLDRFTVAVFKTGDEFFAIKDACPHADYPLSKSKLISPHVVMCNSHNWRFDIRDGRCVKIGKCGHVGRALKVRTFPIQFEQEEIWVVVDNKLSNT